MKWRKRNQKRLADLYSLRQQLKEQKSKLSQATSKMNINTGFDVKKNRFILELDQISFAYSNKKIVKLVRDYLKQNSPALFSDQALPDLIGQKLLIRIS